MSDLIRREDAIEVAYQLRRKPNDEEWDWWIRSFNAIPSADRAQGEWILECDGEGECDNLYRCSECGCEYGCQEYDIPNFCPNCGCQMKEVDDEGI